jgi:N-acetylglucosaminyldiphosphoundecaprenol N-acetyl-beta-D-mannosaminyltransferase
MLNLKNDQANNAKTIKNDNNVIDFNAHVSQKKNNQIINRRNQIEILGANVDDILLDEAVARIENWISTRHSNPQFAAQQVVTLNPEYLTIAQRDAGLMDIINRAGLVTPDGIGLVYAGKALRRPLRGRVTGVELTHALAMRSAYLHNSGEGEMRIFLLGAAEGVAEKAARKLEELYPGVQIAGAFSGNGGPEGDVETLAAVQGAKADVVLVAYGMGKQDRWIVRNLQASGAAAGIVGGTFDYLAGEVVCPPEVVKQLGMEWAYRIVRQKGRWKRAAFVPKFIGAVASELILR